MTRPAFGFLRVFTGADVSVNVALCTIVTSQRALISRRADEVPVQLYGRCINAKTKTLVKGHFTQYGTFKTKVHPSSHDRCWPTPVNSTAGMLIAREESLSAPITSPWLILGEEGASAI